MAGENDKNIHGFCQMIYTVGMLLTTDQGFVNDVVRAVDKYDKRLQKAAVVEENETEEKIAMEEVKQVQEYVEMDEKSRKIREREANRRFKKAIKKVEHEK